MAACLCKWISSWMGKTGKWNAEKQISSGLENAGVIFSDKNRGALTIQDTVFDVRLYIKEKMSKKV
jgi:hypothetical protein